MGFPSLTNVKHTPYPTLTPLERTPTTGVGKVFTPWVASNRQPKMSRSAQVRQ